MRFFKLTLIATLVIVTLSVLMGSTGCSKTQYGTEASQIQNTIVPAVDLDLYIYINQQVPTNVPSSLTGADKDISVQSLSIWGIINNETQYSIGGAFLFNSAADASLVFLQLTNSAGFYTKLLNKTIYFVQGSGGPAESLKNALNNNNLRPYDDKLALAEVDRLPSNATHKPLMIGIVKPDQLAVNLAKKYLDQNTGNTLESLYSDAKPRIIALGVYSSQPIDLTVIAQKVSDNSIWNMDLGVVVSMSSIYPGMIFSPIANQFFKEHGLTGVTVGNLSAFRYSANLDGGKTIQVYLDVSSNHIFLTVSGKDAYAQSLLTGIKR